MKPNVENEMSHRTRLDKLEKKSTKSDEPCPNCPIIVAIREEGENDYSVRRVVVERSTEVREVIVDCYLLHNSEINS